MEQLTSVLKHKDIYDTSKIRPHINSMNLCQIREIQNENYKQSTLVSLQSTPQLIRDDVVLGKLKRWVTESLRDG